MNEVSSSIIDQIEDEGGWITSPLSVQITGEDEYFIRVFVDEESAIRLSGFPACYQTSTHIMGIAKQLEQCKGVFIFDENGAVIAGYWA